jgi:hypothetical protein
MGSVAEYARPASSLSATVACRALTRRAAARASPSVPNTIVEITQRDAMTTHGIVPEARVVRDRSSHERMCELHKKDGAGPH